MNFVLGLFFLTASFGKAADGPHLYAIPQWRYDKFFAKPLDPTSEIEYHGPSLWWISHLIDTPTGYWSGPFSWYFSMRVLPVRSLLLPLYSVQVHVRHLYWQQGAPGVEVAVLQQDQGEMSILQAQKVCPTGKTSFKDFESSWHLTAGRTLVCWHLVLGGVSPGRTPSIPLESMATVGEPETYR